MENYLWCKTLLEAYKDLKREILAQDRKMDKLIGKSFLGGDTLVTLEEMRKVVLHKKNCQIAKEIIEKVILQGEFEKSVLYWRYVAGQQYSDVASIINKQMRQVFRQKDKELVLFAKTLSGMGYDEDGLEKEFGEDAYFVKIHKKVAIKSSNVSKKNLVITHIIDGVYSDSNVASNKSGKEYRERVGKL